MHSKYYRIKYVHSQVAIWTKPCLHCVDPHQAAMEPKAGHGVVKMKQRAPMNRSTRISKEMSRILRHEPPDSIDTQGYVPVEDLRGCMKSKPTVDEIKAVVASCSKQRFVINESQGILRVRAAQGHSVQLEQPVLQPVTDAGQVLCAIHATSNEGWSAIQASGQLSRMKRTHIHFATSPQLLRANKWASVLLKLKVQDALTAGHKFFLSSNDVLLCEGPLPVELVEVISREQLPQDWAAG